MPPIQRVSRVLRWIALVVIIVGPIAIAAVEVHGNGAPLGITARELEASDERVASYWRDRSPLVDRLLPAGRGGTRFFETLPNAVGMAFYGAAAIGLAASADRGAWLESTEVHERAHLVDAFLPAEVAALMARLPAPAPKEIAAEDRGQHFAEMAAKAWEIVTEPTGVCMDGTPESWLEDVESRVPGTAGFVSHFLRVLASPESAQSPQHDRAGLQALADRLSAPQREQWDAIWRGLDARRHADGTFEPWGHRTIRENLGARRAALSKSDKWLDRFAAAAMWPSFAIVTMAGAMKP